MVHKSFLNIHEVYNNLSSSFLIFLFLSIFRACSKLKSLKNKNVNKILSILKMLVFFRLEKQLFRLRIRPTRAYFPKLTFAKSNHASSPVKTFFVGSVEGGFAYCVIISLSGYVIYGLSLVNLILKITWQFTVWTATKTPRYNPGSITDFNAGFIMPSSFQM